MIVRALLVAALIACIAGCSSDPETPLGSGFLSDSLLGSRPGRVFVDTLFTPANDTSFAVSSLLTSNTFLTLGRRDDYRTAIVLRADLSAAGEDTLKTVIRAALWLRFTNQSQTDVLGARFYEMLEPFGESDTITALNRSATAIPDGDQVNVDREMIVGGWTFDNYTLPVALVQNWIRGLVPHNGVAVVPSDTTVATQITFGSSENTDSGLKPFLHVEFFGGTSTSYPMSDDATFVEWLGSTSNLIISDGYVQRAYIPVDLGGIAADVAIHKAELVLHLVPGTEIGNEFNVRLYAPKSSVVGSTTMFTGTGITTFATDIEDGRIVLPVRNVLLFFLEGVLANYGFVLQFSGEGSQIRQLELYSSAAAPDLRPSIRITYSTPAEFDAPGRDQR